MPLTARRVVVPIDFSTASPQAIAAALAVVDAPSRLHLIHVMQPLETMSPGVLMSNLTDELREQAGEQNLEDAFVRLIGSEEGLHA